MNLYLTELVRYLAAQSWQIAVLTLVVAAATWALRHKTAHIRYLLWLIVLAKCLVPPFFAVPLEILPQKTAPPAVMEPTPIVPKAGIATESIPSSRPHAVVESGRVEQGDPPRVDDHPSRPLDLRLYAGIAWIAGAGLYLAMNLLRALRGQHWLGARRRPLPVEIRRDTESLLSTRSGRPLPPIWIIDEIGQPFVWGLLRGSIYVPSRFLELGDPEHRRHVVAHELSHVLRFDAAVNALQTLAQGLFWFHPFVWWANRQIRREREKCCDEMAVAQLGTEARAYCHAVVETLASAETSARPVPSLAVAGPARNLEERIKTMLRPDRRFYRRPTAPTALVVLLMAMVTVPTAVVLTVRAQADSTQREVPMELDDVNNVLDTYETARHVNSPDRYLMVLRNDRHVIVTYKDGPKHCWTSYNFSGPIRSGRLIDPEAVARERAEAGETIASILAWAEDRTPQSAETYDGTRGYRLSSDGFGHLKSSPSRGLRTDRVGTPFTLSPTIERLAWPAIRWPKSPKSTCRIISDDHLALDKGLICIEEQHEVTHSELGVIPHTTRFYLNPEKGYICHRWHEAISDYAEEVTVYGQTDQGQWYPLEVSEFGRRDFRTPMTRKPVQINVVLLDTNPTFPEGVFDPNALLARHEADLVFDPPEEAPIPHGASDTSKTRVAGRVLEGETRAPIVGALVRVAAPALDMRDTRIPTEQTIYQARTDPDGAFELSVPITEKMEAISVDAIARGYNTAAGTFRTGNSNPMLMRVPLDSRWRMIRSNLTVMLPKGLYVAGTVRDDQGRPVPGMTVFATLRTERSSGGIARTQTDAQGRFEIFDYPLQKQPDEWAVLSFTSATTLQENVTGLYDMTEEQRGSLEVTVHSGREITGVVHNAAGHSAAGITVEAVAGWSIVIRETTTDRDGHFELAGLPAGPLDVRACDLASDQKAMLPITAGNADREVTVRMQPIKLTDPVEPVTMLGMQVVDVTQELQEAYDMDDSEGVMIWDPGTDSDRLGIGELKKGYCIWMIGDKRITNFKEMVAEILRAQLTPWQDGEARFRDPPARVRVVYSTRGSNNTQHLKLTAADVAELGQLADRLGIAVMGDNP